MYIGKSPNVNRLRLNPRSSDPTSPLEGDLQYADGSARAEGLWTYQNGAWTQVGSSNGAKNYVLNGNFEGSGTTGFSLSSSTIDSTTKVPNQASGSWSAAAGTLSIAQVTSAQLAGRASISLVSSGATTVGNMLITDAFTIDKEDQSKVLTFKFYYEAFSGTANCNFSGTSTNSFSVQIYDVTNSVWIQPAGTFGMTQGAGVGICTGTFQTSSNSTQYQLAISFANATAGAATLYMDDFFVGPQTAPIGPVVTDWISYIPTGSWSTNSTYTGFWRRDGDSMEVQAKVALAGAPTSANLTINLPSGFTIDTAKLTDTIVNANDLGQCGINDSSTTLYKGYVAYNSSTSIQVRYQSNASGASSIVTQAAPITFGSGDSVMITYRVPIVGWSSNVKMSNDTDTRVVAAAVQGDPAATTANNPIIFPTIDYDTHGAYNATTGEYTVPVSGVYKIQGYLAIAAAVTQTTSLYVDGVSVVSAGISSVAGVAGFWVNASYKCSAGQKLTIRPNVGINVTGSCNLSIERLSGPSVIAATETVAARYNSTSVTLTNNAQNTVTYTVKDFDTHNAYASGVYTIPVSGKYAFSASLLTNAFASGAVGNTFQVIVQKNSVDYAAGVQSAKTTSSVIHGAQVNDVVNCVAGDTIRVQYFHNLGATPTIGSSTTSNTFSIERIGN